jgi:hypothetical protein
VRTELSLPSQTTHVLVRRKESAWYCVAAPNDARMNELWLAWFLGALDS